MESSEELVRGDSRFRRHINPDGTKGGWVNRIASVDASVYVGVDAEIDYPAHVTGNARILDTARVRGNVGGNAVIRDESFVEAGSTVKDNAVLSGKCRLDSINSVIGGNTYFQDIELYGRDYNFSGGEFKGEFMGFLVQHLGIVADRQRNMVDSLYLTTEHGPETMANVDELKKYITLVRRDLPEKGTRGR